MRQDAAKRPRFWCEQSAVGCERGLRTNVLRRVSGIPARRLWPVIYATACHFPATPGVHRRTTKAQILLEVAQGTAVATWGCANRARQRACRREMKAPVIAEQLLRSGTSVSCEMMTDPMTTVHPAQPPRSTHCRTAQPEFTPLLLPQSNWKTGRVAPRVQRLARRPSKTSGPRDTRRCRASDHLLENLPKLRHWWTFWDTRKHLVNVHKCL